MKSIKVLAGVFALTAFGFASCSDDDSDSVNDDNQIAGTYNLVEVNTSEDTDFNMDGTSNENQALESDCYDDGRIVLNADGTLTYYHEYILVDESNGTSTCASADYAGTWVIDMQAGSTVIIDATYVNDNDQEVDITLTKQGNRISYYNMFSEFPDRNSENGATYTNGDVEYVFEKE